MHLNFLNELLSVQGFLVQVVVLLVLELQGLDLVLEHHVVVRHLQLDLLRQCFDLLLLLLDQFVYLFVLHFVEVFVEARREAD